MSDKKFTLPTEEQGKAYFKTALGWVGATKAPFSDCRTCAASAIAEYLANQDGYTLYQSVADYYA